MVPFFAAFFLLPEKPGLACLIAGYALLQSDGDLAITLARHGSLWAVVVCASQLGLYGATLLALVFGAGREVSA